MLKCISLDVQMNFGGLFIFVFIYLVEVLFFLFSSESFDVRIKIGNFHTTYFWPIFHSTSPENMIQPLVF